MNIFIIGSKGFIGQILCKKFSKLHNCFGADIIVSNEKNYFTIDCSNPDYEQIFNQHNFDVCINASGLANVSLSMERPDLDYSLNTINVHKMLDAIRLYAPNCMYVLLSSAAVYGNPSVLPVKESSKLAPISPYGYDKVQAEVICEMYRKVFGIKTFVLRLFSIYGKGQKKQVIWDIVKKFKIDNEVVLFGNGDETRDFIHVDDVYNSINTIITSVFQKEYIFNIANGIEIKISQIASIIKDLLKSDKKIIFSGNTKCGDPVNWKADISKIKSLGYIQQVSFTSGIEDYIYWAMAELNNV